MGQFFLIIFHSILEMACRILKIYKDIFCLFSF